MMPPREGPPMECRGDRLSRREFVVGAGVGGLGLLAGCGRLPGQAQQPARVLRIGFLTPGPRESRSPPAPGIVATRDAFREGLRDLGYIEGENLVVEWRSTDGGEDRLL